MFTAPGYLIWFHISKDLVNNFIATKVKEKSDDTIKEAKLYHGMAGNDRAISFNVSDILKVLKLNRRSKVFTVSSIVRYFSTFRL